ncbi:MAG: CHAT domain-containing protein [Planctomycetota bacterium]
MLQELRAADRGETKLSNGRLEQLFHLVIDWEMERPNRGPGVPWSEPLGLLSAQLAQRPGLVDFAVVVAQAHGKRLDNEGRRDEALAVLRAGLERYEDNLYSIYLSIELGTLLRDEHEFGAALDELRAAEQRVRLRSAQDGLSSYDRDNLRLFDALVLAELGSACEQLGMSDTSDDYFERSEARALELDVAAGKYIWGAGLVYRLNSLNHRGRYRQAAALEEAIAGHAWFPKLPPETADQIRLRLAMARVQAAFKGQEEPGSAEEALLELLEEGLLKPDEQIRAWGSIATSRLDGGSLYDATEALDECSALLEEMEAHDPQRLHVLGLRARLPLLRDDAEAGRRLLEDELRPAFETFLERWQRGPIEAAGVAILSQERIREALSGLINLELLHGGGAEAAFDWVLRIQALGTFAREHGIGTPTLDEIRATLIPAGRGLLAYVPGRIDSHLFIADAGAVRHLRLAAFHELEAASAELVESIAGALRSSEPRAGRRLDAALFDAGDAFLPEEARAHMDGWNAVAVAGLDSFGYVPIEALTGPHRVPLGETHLVTWQPSIPVGVWLAERAGALPEAAGSLTVYAGTGDPAVGGRPDLAPIEAGLVTATGLGLDAFDGTAIQVQLALAGPALDPASAFRGSALLHILAHGVYDSDRIRPAGVLLAPEASDGTWFAEDFERTSAPAAVIVTGCGTGRARLRRGDDGRGHLRSAFFEAGAVCAVTSTMELELAASLDFVARLHGHLARGGSMAGSLWSARREAQPQRHGVHWIHSFLMHAWGEGGYVPTPRPGGYASAATQDGEPGESTPPSRMLVTWLAAAGAIFALVALVRKPREAPTSPSDRG